MGFFRHALVGALFASTTLHAGSIWNSSESPEGFRVEVTGSAWLVDSAGTIQANGTPVDLISDLGGGTTESKLLRTAGLQARTEAPHCSRRIAGEYQRV